MSWVHRRPGNTSEGGGPSRASRSSQIRGRLALVYTWLVLGALLSACALNLAEDITPPPGYRPPLLPTAGPTATPVVVLPASAPDPAAGAAIYAEKCADCHGDTGRGDGPQADQLPNPVAPIGDPELARLAEPARWFDSVTRGNLDRFMPPFSASLSVQERWNVVAYAYGFSAPNEQVQKGAALYQENCAACHGEGGRGDGPEAEDPNLMPDLTGQPYRTNWSAARFFNVITNGIAPGMPAYASVLPEPDRWALAEYLRDLSSWPSEPGPAVAVPETEVVATPLAAVDPSGEGALMGTVTGQVTNGSGGGVDTSLSVTLRGYDNMTEVYSTTTTLSEGGVYLFQEVEMPEGRVYLVTVPYGGATYGSDVAIVQPGMDQLELPVTVFDTTSDPDELFVDRLHLFLDFNVPGSVQVTELYLISNPGDRVVVPGAEDQPAVTFPLPEGAANLQFQDGVLGERFVETEDGFGDLAAIQPGSGQYQVLFAFDLAYNGKLDLQQSLKLPVNAVILLLPDDGIRVRSDQLQDSGVRDIQGESFRVYSGDGLPAEGLLSLSLSGQPRAAGAELVEAGSSASLAIGVGAFGLALLIAGVWLYRRNRLEASALELEAPRVAEDDLLDSETVMDAIIALDDMYQEGDLPEEAYLERRAELKTRLRELLDEAA